MDLTPEFLANKDAILSTIAAAGRKDQLIRYWLGAGRGGFAISPAECVEPSFYCISQKYTTPPPEVYTEGVSIVTSSVPMKPAMFSRMKTTNYLPNALVTKAAERAGFWSGVWVTDAGNVAEFPTLNIGFSLDGKGLVLPTFDATLAGITAQRVMHIARERLGMSVEQRHVRVEEAKAAREAVAMGGNLTVVPIVGWDGEVIGNGRVGDVAKRLREALLRDLEDGWGEEGVLRTVEGIV